MKNRILALGKSIALCATALAFFAIASGEARADEVFISGFTNGCFNCGAPPQTSAAQSDTLMGLSYTNSTFSGTTAGGFRGLGGNPGAGSPPAQSVNNLGTFSLSPEAASYAGNTFTLRVTFTAPEGINGSNTAVFTATLTGTVINNDTGGVSITFNGPGSETQPLLFTFNDTNCGATTLPGQQTTCGEGSFLFLVRNLSIDPGQNASLTGEIRGAQQTVIPEPATLLLLGTGLSGIAASVRRRRNAAKK